MTTRTSSDRHHDDRLPGEAALTRLYRAVGSLAPPEALDRRILAEAEAAVARDRRQAARRMRWAAPAAAAAVVVLSASLILMLKDRGIVDYLKLTAPSPHQPPALQPEPAPPVIAAEEAAKKAAAPSSKPEPVPPASPAFDMAADVKQREEQPHLPARPPETASRGWRTQTGSEERSHASIATPDTAMVSAVGADVIYVQATGNPEAYQFVVGIRAPATGCEQYVDWWEVLTEDGQLLYRRVLSYSHKDKQPFITTGGPVPIQPDAVVWVRAHMNNSGYGGRALRGSVQAGFQPAELPAEFAAALARQPPLPGECAY